MSSFLSKNCSYVNWQFLSLRFVKLGPNCPLCCVVTGSWSETLVLKAKLACGGLLGLAFSECGSLGRDTMPGQGDATSPLWSLPVCSP